MANDFEVRIDRSGFDRLLREVGPDTLAQRERAAMNESLAFLQTEVQRNTPVFEGTLRRGIFTEVRGSAMGLQGTVAPSAATRDYAGVVEHGRRPGRFPPLEPLRHWAARVLGDAGLAFVVARAIARRGTKGQFMFKRAFDKGRTRVPQIFDRHFRF